MTHILIIVVPLFFDAIAAHSVEFATKEACEAARAQIERDVAYDIARYSIRCFPKGDTK